MRRRNPRRYFAMTSPALELGSARAIARAIAAGECSATELVEASLERIARVDRTLNSFTAVTADRALATAFRSQ